MCQAAGLPSYTFPPVYSGKQTGLCTAFNNQMLSTTRRSTMQSQNVNALQCGQHHNHPPFSPAPALLPHLVCHLLPLPLHLLRRPPGLEAAAAIRGLAPEHVRIARQHHTCGEGHKAAVRVHLSQGPQGQGAAPQPQRCVPWGRAAGVEVQGQGGAQGAGAGAGSAGDCARRVSRGLRRAHSCCRCCHCCCCWRWR